MTAVNAHFFSHKSLVGSMPGREKNDMIQFKLVTGIFCNQKMPIMNGIEGTAKYTDFLFVQSHIPYSISDGLRQNNLWIFLIRFI